ncbi:hypothetical protein EMIT0P253_370024 [Pseudomonas sp. IT-P253]
MRGLRSTKNVAFLHASVVRSRTATDVTDLRDSVMFPVEGYLRGFSGYLWCPIRGQASLLQV